MRQVKGDRLAADRAQGDRVVAGVVFVGVDELDDPSTAVPRQFLKTYHVSYPNGWDPGDVDIQYGTTGQPETFFITPHGVIKSKYTMPFTDDRTLAALIQEARA